jgi:nitrile hydratase
MPTASLTRYQTGDRVRVRVGSPPGHFRTPAYIQGKSGLVVAVYGPFPNPESLAYGGSGLPTQPLYRVEFDQVQVWKQYTGPATDKVLVDIYQHWLEQA